MTYNYSYNDSRAPVNQSNVSGLPLPVQRNPPLPVANPFRPPAGPSSPIVKSPVEAQPPAQGGGSIWDALRSLFSGSSSQGQGMTGMLNTPRGVDSLGNPVNRFPGA